MDVKLTDLFNALRLVSEYCRSVGDCLICDSVMCWVKRYVKPREWDLE